MKIVVMTRDDAQPFARAVKETVTILETRAWQSIEEAKKDVQGRRFLRECKAVAEVTDAGESPYLRGEIEREAWVIDVPDIDALVDLFRENGDYLLSKTGMYKE